MPVYNVEKYLPETIQSVLCQHFEHYEAIFVNDASTDSCPSLLNKTQQEHPHKIKVIHLKENRGTHYARKIGVQHATGKFISFLDGDDTFLPHAFETMACEMHKNPADILRFDVAFCDLSSNILSRKTGFEEWFNPSFAPVFGHQQVLAHLFLKKNAAHNVFAALYPAALIQKTFEHLSNAWIVSCEDQYTTLILAHFAQSLRQVNVPVYVYRLGSGVSFNQMDLNKAALLLLSFLNIEKGLKNFPLHASVQHYAQNFPKERANGVAKAYLNAWENMVHGVFENEQQAHFALYHASLRAIPMSRAEKLGKFLLFPFYWLQKIFQKLKNNKNN